MPDCLAGCCYWLQIVLDLVHRWRPVLSRKQKNILDTPNTLDIIKTVEMLSFQQLHGHW